MFRRRWSPASKAFVLLAVAAAVASYGLVRGYAARLEALRPSVGAPEPVVVAAGPIDRGAIITDAMVRVERMPAAFSPPGAIRSLARVLGKAVESDLVEGEAVTRTRLAAANAGPVASLVPPGLRAFAVGVAIPAGSVHPGDRVDVLATFGGPRPHTETAATGLEVLLVMGPAGADATAISSSSADGPSLVLLVSPEQAEQLSYASAFADLAVSIEGPDEQAASSPEGN